MQENRCKAKVWRDGIWRQYQCTRKEWKDGYCKQHHPDTVKKREEEQEKRFQERQAKTPLRMALKRIDELNAENKILKEEIELLKYRIVESTNRRA